MMIRACIVAVTMVVALAGATNPTMKPLTTSDADMMDIIKRDGLVASFDQNPLSLGSGSLSNDRSLSTTIPCPSGYFCNATGVLVEGPSNVLVLGGHDGGNRNDVWSSSDGGASWTEVAVGSRWSARNYHTSAVLPGSTNAELCAEGYWCLEGSTTAQGSGPCDEGYYCPAGSTTAQGAGQCDVGYVCPPGSSTSTGIGTMAPTTSPTTESPSFPTNHWVNVGPPYSGSNYFSTGLTYEAFGALNDGELVDTWGLAEGATDNGRASYLGASPRDSTTCSDACQHGVHFPDSSEAYTRCNSFLDAFLPNERSTTAGWTGSNGTDFTGYEFRLDTNTDTARGCTFDPIAKILFYNQNSGTGNCTASRQCICQCSSATAAPTLSPVVPVEEHADFVDGSIPCSPMPRDTFGNPDGVPVDLALSNYTKPTVVANVITGGADFTVRPFINWRSEDLFNQDDAFPFVLNKADGHVLVSGWLDYLAPTDATFAGGPDFPYLRLKDGEDTSCRVIMNSEGRFNDHEVKHADGCTFATADNSADYTNYSFYVATTLCYTIQPVEQCTGSKVYGADGSRTWQSDAFTMPYEWKAAYTQFVPAHNGTDGDDADWDSAAHVAQCRREWQAVRLRVKYGGDVTILDTVTLDVAHVVQQPDGTIEVPESEQAWQKYDDFAPQQLDWDHFKNGGGDTGTGRYKVVDGVVQAVKDTTAAGDGQQLIEFGSRYSWKFVVDDTIFFGDKNLQQLVLEQYDKLDVDYEWQRCLEEFAPCTVDAHWTNLDDYYSVDATLPGDNGDVSYATTHSLTNTIAYGVQGTESIVDFSVVSGLNIKNTAYIEDDVRLHLVLTWSSTTRRDRRLSAVTNVAPAAGSRQLQEGSNDATAVAVRARVLQADGTSTAPASTDSINAGHATGTGVIATMACVAALAQLAAQV